MPNQPNFRAYLALAVVCLFWGTSYFAIRIGVETFPPFLFSALRQLTAGGILLLGLKWMGSLKVTRQDIANQAVPGILMIAAGNGVISWCERIIPSGLAALILSLIPIFVVGISYLLRFEQQKPHPYVITGLTLGICGIGLIFRDNIRDLARPDFSFGMLIAFGACMSWALGTVLAKFKTRNSANILQNAALQLFTGGTALLILSLMLDNYAELHSVTPASLTALAYLILFGSVLSYSAFVYALKHLPIGISSLYAYINPVIALLLGSFFLAERLTLYTFAALAVILMGVYLINRGYSKQDEKTSRDA